MRKASPTNPVAAPTSSAATASGGAERRRVGGRAAESSSYPFAIRDFRLRHYARLAGQIAFELVETLAICVDELNVYFFGRNVNVIEAEALVIDETSLRGTNVVEPLPAAPFTMKLAE